MNAIPQRSHRYNRIQVPQDPMPLRKGSVHNVEYLDEHRAKKLRHAAQKREQEAERLRISELENYYNMKRYSAQENRQAHNRRKINAAYEVKPMQAHFKQKQHRAKMEAAPQAQPERDDELLLETAPKADANANHAAQAAPAPRRRGIASTILSIALVFMMLAGVLVKQAEISNQTYLNSQAEKRIATLQEELSKLEMDKALKEDLTSVQYNAAARGMAQPEDDQVVFLEAEPELPDTYEPAEEAPQNTITDLSGNTDIKVSGAVVSTDAGSDAGIVNTIGKFFKDAGEVIKGWIE